MNNLQDLFNDVIEDEAEEDDLDPQNKVVPSIHVAQELAFGHDYSLSHLIFYFQIRIDMNWFHLYWPEVCPHHKSSSWRDLESNLHKY